MALDYEDLIMLDAEDLAEGGIGEAYASIVPRLREYVSEPAEVEDRFDEQGYTVRAGGKERVVYGPENAEESWPLATFVLFDIVNAQLEGATHRFYAINGGNDLGGMFLTEQEVEAARNALPSRTDWPYLPTLSPSWYGQFH